MCEMTDEMRQYWRQWTTPSTVIALGVAGVSLYTSHVVQQERLSTLKAQVERVEREYQRRDVLTETLRTIDMRLSGIELKLDERRTTIGPVRR